MKKITALIAMLFVAAIVSAVTVIVAFLWAR